MYNITDKNQTIKTSCIIRLNKYKNGVSRVEFIMAFLRDGTLAAIVTESDYIVI